MPRLNLKLFSIALIPLAVLTGCDADQGGSSSSKSKKEIAEHIDKEEALEALRLQSVTDPIADTIDAYRKQMADLFYAQNFAELEKESSAARTSKEVFGNGSWKIYQFYGSFERDNKDALGLWNVTEENLQAWLKAFPDSVTARIAYANFLADYAWHARGTGYADTVTDKGWELMHERLTKAGEVLNQALKLPEKDPYLYYVALQVALGKGLDKPDYDRLVEEAHAAEPTFWAYDTARAYSLLPRWYGEKGEWVAFASAAAERPDGPGKEVYARILMRMLKFHENVFKDTRASWSKTKEGLEILRKKYPESVEILSYAAILATFAGDRKSAKAYFDELGDRYLGKSSIWPSKESFVHYRKWARTGKW